MKRAGVYVFYDKDGIVDDYAPYFVKELHTVVDYIVVVVNGKLTPDGRKKFAACADDLFVRPNEGYDSWGYKEGIEYIGWERLKTYDELVLANSSIYGPIFPFSEVFQKMDADDCDCWGMTTNYEIKNTKTYLGVSLKWGYKPEVVASNFHVYKSSVLHSYEFANFWTNLPPIKTYGEAGVYMEVSLVQGLKDAGFVWAAVDQGGMKGVYPAPTVYGAYELIHKYRVPTIRKKAFFDPMSPLDFCESVPSQVLRYVSSHTNYDCNLILDNLLRTVNLYDLKNWFNLNTILPTDYVLKKPTKQRIGCIFHAYNMEIMEQYVHNICSFPEGTDFFFTTDTEEKQNILKDMMSPYCEKFHFTYRLIENRGRDVASLLVGCRDVVLFGGYDLICFMHDKTGIGASLYWSCVGHTSSDVCFDNIAPTTEYVENVMQLFDKHPRLGLAVPPPPKNGLNYSAIGGNWTCNFQNTKKLLQDLNITVPLDPKKPPVAPYGSIFWFRPNALRPLFEKEWTYENFVSEPMPNDGTISHAIERAHGYIAQGQGYYTTIIMTPVYAEQEVTRMTEIAHSYVDLTKRYVGSGKPMLSTATAQMERLLTNAKMGTALANTKKLSHRGPLKQFVRGICPIGIWNQLRKVKCKLSYGIYVESDSNINSSKFKKIIRACTPRYLWDILRRIKCWKNGWVFVEE